MGGMAEVAARAGVSSGVVSRVISGDSSLRISDDTRSRVLQAVEDLQYVPRYAARALRYQKPSALTLVLPEATSAVHAPLVRGVEQAAARRDLGMMLASSEYINEQPEWLDRIVREGRTDGVIFQAPPELRPTQIMAVTDVPAPVILINSDETSSDRTLVFNDAGGVSVAVRFLTELGHRDIGFIGAPAEHAAGSRRLSGFTATMKSLGYRVHEEWITRSGFTSEQGRAAARVLLKRETLPTAVVVANLNAATGFLAELHSNAIDVPGRLSIVAFHDAWLAESTWPPLTTVQMPFFEMGETAVDMLFDSESGPEHRVLSAPAPILMQRQSARPL